MGDLPNVPREVVYDRMQACDIALITSHRESGPLVAREAIACGLPVAAVEVGDLSTWLPEFCIADDRTPEALADSVEAILESNSEEIQIPTSFNPDEVERGLTELFTLLLQAS